MILKDDPAGTGKAWEDWVEELEREFRYFKITDPVDKADAMIIFGGKEVSRLKKNLPDVAGDDDYARIKNKLDGYFKPAKNKQHSRYRFSKLRPESGESTAAYVARLREAASNGCDFGGNTDERILEHLIQTTSNEMLIQKAINKGWDLTQFVQEARYWETDKGDARCYSGQIKDKV